MLRFTSKRLGTVVAVGLMLVVGGCTTETGVPPERTRVPAPERSAITQRPEQPRPLPTLLRALAEAIESGNAEAIRQLSYTNSDLMQVYINTSAEAAAAGHRAEQAVRQLAPNEEAAAEFIESIITAPAPSREAALLRAEADDVQTPDRSQAVISTDEGLRFNETVPPPGQDPEAALFQLSKAAFGTQQLDSLIVFYDHLAEIIETGEVTTFEELQAYDFESYLEEQLIEERRQWLREPWEAILAEARSRDLEPLVADLEAALNFLETGEIPATQPGEAPTTQPESQ